MRIDVSVLSAAPSGVEDRRSRRRSHFIEIDAEKLSTPASVFDEFAAALDFPKYFGRNWDALDECFSDYFIIEEGGLGSEFGGRVGIDADAVRIVFTHAGKLIRGESSMVANIAALLRYTLEANANRIAADLSVEFLVEDPIDRAALEAALASAC
jgi:hypothetical protein